MKSRPLLTWQQIAAYRLRRYLSAYGPATPRDFSKWSGLSVPESITAWKSVREELAEIESEDRRAFILRKDWDELFDAHLEGSAVRLLPNFDAFLLDHADKSAFVSARHYKQVYRPAGWISAAVLGDGRVISTWSFARVGKTTTLEIAPFTRFSPSHRAALETEAANTGRFLETDWDIKVIK